MTGRSVLVHFIHSHKFSNYYLIFYRNEFTQIEFLVDAHVSTFLADDSKAKFNK